MSEQLNTTKIKKSYFTIIFWLVLIIFAYFTAKYLLNEWSYKQARKKAESQFSNIELEIYKTNEGNKIDKVTNQQLKLDDSPTNQNDLLLKQHLQITQLQSDYNALRSDLAMLKLNDSLPKIILSFVKLKNLIDFKMNYDEELQKLELLVNKDQNLVNKIKKLKFFLQKQPKNKKELLDEFDSIIPIIFAKKIIVENNNSLIDKIRANISQFIMIKKIGEANKSNLEMSVANTRNFINAAKYHKALLELGNIDDYYQETLSPIKSDLKNIINLQLISSEIYHYLEVISDNANQTNSF
jgi:hypothetical protein